MQMQMQPPIPIWNALTMQIEALEFWHLMLGTLTLVLGFGIKWLASGFQRFSTSLAEFRAEVKEALKDASSTMREDLATLKDDVGRQVSGLEHKMERHEDRMREMSLLLERRVNRIEARIDHYPFVPSDGGGE